MYCNINDILNVISEKELVNLTNDWIGSGAGGAACTADYTRFNMISEDVDSLINGYLRARYSLPLKTVPAFIRTIAADICVYRLYSRRSLKIPEHVADNYENALSALSDIQKGNILLETSSENDSMANLKSGFRCSKKPQNRIFKNNMLKAFRGL